MFGLAPLLFLTVAYRQHENRQRMRQAARNRLTRGPRGEEAHADMAESAGHSRSARANLGGGAHPCDQGQASRGPNRPQPLPGGDESDSPTDENRRAEVVQLTGLKIDIPEPIHRAC
jgi:hypothetical protein